ncbi:hypothetical protein GCM10009624_09550 [Gordonia sinesedis]
MTQRENPPAPAQSPGRSAVSIRRIARFTTVMYKPQYLLYGVLWVLALEGTAAWLGGMSWRPGADTAVRVGVVAIVLLYLRMVDEQKDLDYDRQHNPDRPLVTGAVSAADLRAGMAAIAVVAVAGSAALSIGSAVAIVAVLLYGLALWGLEELCPPVRTSILLNLAVTYPVQILVTVYVVVSAADTGQIPDGFVTTGSFVALLVVLAGAFLQFELARKISRRPRPGETYYSNVLGVTGGVAACVGCAVVAVAVLVSCYAPADLTGAAAVLAWLPVAELALPLAGAVAFWRGRGDDYPPVPAALFVLVLYATMIAVATTAPGA